ncbi:MAG: redoxin domain-containing protein [Chloroflexi bacterium]|nr:redoxin domain-containing protein [Chloroflexota bacterium]
MATQPYFRNDVVKAGQPAPDFTLEDTNGNTVSLSDFRGLPLMIEFGSIT